MFVNYVKVVRFIRQWLSFIVLLGVSGGPLTATLPAVPQPASSPARQVAEAIPAITSDQAIAVALNDLEVTENGYRLSHPQHSASFTSQGVTFTPKRGGPAWSWQLTAVGAGDRSLAGARLGAMDPSSTGSSVVAYERGALVEQYLAHGNNVEQQFVIPQPLDLGGADLVIEGAVQSAGRFEALEDGWSWRAGTGAVHLGDVRAFDAAGQALPATMRVTADATHIAVDGQALAKAAYPVTIDPEIGTNDVRLSDMGQEGSWEYTARDPAVAYNSTHNQYLVVWSGNDNTGSLVEGESEIFGQRVDAATGAEIGGDLRFSDMGPDGDTAYNASSPAVAYNSANNEYLVVWYGDDATDEEFEIFGQRVGATGGGEVGENDFRLSDMGPDENPDYGAFNPAVAYNSANNEYLVVWYGDDNTLNLVDEEFEIFGQRVDAASGAEIENDFRLSDMGPDGNTDYEAQDPVVAYNSADNEYLVVWRGNDYYDTLAEYEIYGQRVDAATGAEIGGDLRFSDMGPDMDAEYGPYESAVTYNSTDNEYLVVWSGTDNTPPLVQGQSEIFGQRLNAATGGEVGENDFCLSDMGDAQDPAVTYNSADNEYLVVWSADDNIPPLVVGEDEIFGQRLDAETGAEVGENDFRLSDMGPDGDIYYDAAYPALAYNSANDEYLAVWQSDDDIPPLVNNEFEIFGQRLAGGTGAEVGENDVRLSDMGGDLDYDAYEPAVAYNSTNDEYLVVWSGDDNAAGLADDEFEIYAQRVDAITGEEIGTDFRLSDMGPDGEADYDAESPAVAYNSTDNEYLVVWEGHDRHPSLIYSSEYDIYGQRVDGASGLEIGNDFRLSSMGPDWNTDYRAEDPAVVYNDTDNEYLVVWMGDDDTAPLVNDEYEIFGQRVNAATGAEVGENDIRLSDMGPNGNTGHGAYEPQVAYNSTNNEYLVVWMGDDIATEEHEIYAQRVDGSTGAEVGTNDFRLSEVGTDGDGDYDAFVPAVAYNSLHNEYLVVWSGDNDKLPTAGKYEIYGQRVNAATGAEVGTNDFQLSDMGPSDNVNYDAFGPAVAYDSSADEYLVVWHGDDVLPPDDDEFEIFGQRLEGATGAEVGENDVRLSDMGMEADIRYGAFLPAVAYGTDGEYLVVWYGDDDRNGMVNDEHEIFGQRFTSVAEEGITGLSATNDGPTPLGSPTTLSATITAGSNVSYAWTFGDGGSGDGAVVTYTYATAGIYTAVVTASNSISISTATTQVTVTEEGITGLVATNDGPTPLGSPTTLTATITAGSNVSYTWAFGDGGSSDGAVVVYTYATAGVYTAVVTASNSISISTATTQVTVTEESGYVVYLPLVVKNE